MPPGTPSTSAKTPPLTARRRIVQEMMKKGFSRDTIDGALTGIETDEDALEALAFKKYGRALQAELEAGEEAEPSGFNRGGFTQGPKTGLSRA